VASAIEIARDTLYYHCGSKCVIVMCLSFCCPLFASLQRHLPSGSICSILLYQELYGGAARSGWIWIFDDCGLRPAAGCFSRHFLSEVSQVTSHKHKCHVKSRKTRAPRDRGPRAPKNERGHKAKRKNAIINPSNLPLQ
jgi:hypothetical protein